MSDIFDYVGGIDSLLEEVEQFLEKLDTEPGVHTFNGRDYRKNNGKIQVFDEDEKRWMNMDEAFDKLICELRAEAFDKSIRELCDLIGVDEEDDEKAAKKSPKKAKSKTESSKTESKPGGSDLDKELEKLLSDFAVIVDVVVDGDDVICTFADGEVQTAHCHPDDSWSLDTAISVCLGKYLLGGSSEYNRRVRHGAKIFHDKIKAEAKRLQDQAEEQRIRENQKRKRERYLKRRAERLQAEAFVNGSRLTIDPGTGTITLVKGGKTVQLSSPKFSSLFNELAGFISD